jgi:hypothetical protein
LSALDAARLADLGSATGTDTLSDYARDSWAAFDAHQLCHLMDRDFVAAAARPIMDPPASLASNPGCCFAPPHTKAVLATSGTSGFTFHGSLDFLDDWSLFDKTPTHRCQAPHCDHFMGLFLTLQFMLFTLYHYIY